MMGFGLSYLKATLSVALRRIAPWQGLLIAYYGVALVPCVFELVEWSADSIGPALLTGAR